MAWTQYEDALLTEMLGLMSEPGFQSSSYITNRLGEIRTALATSQSSQFNTEAKLNQLLGQYETAKTAADQANEERYGQILGGYDTLGSQWDSTYGTQIEGAQKASRDQETARLNDLVGKYSTGMGGVVSGYGTRRSDLEGLLEGLGDRQLADISQRYQAQRGSSAQDLSRRGLGNSTVMSSVDQGLQRAETEDLERAMEQIRREQLGYRSQWSADELQAQERREQQLAGMRQGSSDRQSQAYQNLIDSRLGRLQGNQQLGLGKLGAIERREDIAPSLGDIANLALQSGRGASDATSLPGFQSLMRFTQPTGGGGNALFG